MKNNDQDPVAAFYNNETPSVKLFNEIDGVNRLNAIKTALASCPQDEFLTHLCFIILKTASISEQSQEAKDLTQSLYKEAFEYGKNNDRVNFT